MHSEEAHKSYPAVNYRVFHGDVAPLVGSIVKAKLNV